MTIGIEIRLEKKDSVEESFMCLGESGLVEG